MPATSGRPVSCVQDVIEALRAGARNFLRKPYSFEELEESILTEVKHFRAFRENRQRQEREEALEDFITSIDSVAYTIPNDISWINSLAFRLVGYLKAVSFCGEEGRLNVALGLIEMITNAIEHGNLGISSEKKIALKVEGEDAYFRELSHRAREEPYKSRQVKVVFTLSEDRASFRIEDEGDGFDTAHLPDPTDPEMLFAPSGRGILLTRTFLDDVSYNKKGNVVTLIKNREPADT